MFTKPWFRCGLVAGASLLAGGAWAASANNGYVKVSSSTPGVVGVVRVGLDFHITTANVSDAFKADVDVNAESGWELLSPNPTSFKMSVGEKRGYEVRSQSNEEDKAGGNIFLFKVDVEIDGVGEGKEETEGAFVGYADCANGFDPACVAAMKPVKIRCLPANRPDNEKIVLTFPSGHLLEKVGTTYQAAQSSYKANEIGGKSFWLHGHAASGAVRDKAIKAEHSANHCKDEAKFTVLSVNLNAAYSDQISGRECNALPGQNPMYMGARADNRGYLQIGATILPQQINNIGMVGVRHGTDILVSEPIQTPKTPIDFAPTGGRELYEIVAGCDLNTDGTLQNSEVTEVLTNQLMLITQGDYNYSDGLLTAFAIGTIGVGSQLLEAFIDDTIPPNVVNSATTIASTELTHPIGANWDASCSASTRLYTYVEGTDVSDDVEEDSHTITALQTSLGQHQSEVQDYFTQNPTVNEHTFGPWNWQANGLDFDGLALQFAFGHVNIAGTVSVTVRRSDLAVTHISYAGSFTDIYDFNYVGAYPSVHGATMQAGFPTLGTGGRVFRDRVEFSRDTTSFSYDFN